MRPCECSATLSFHLREVCGQFAAHSASRAPTTAAAATSPCRVPASGEQEGLGIEHGLTCSALPLNRGMGVRSTHAITACRRQLFGGKACRLRMRAAARCACLAAASLRCASVQAFSQGESLDGQFRCPSFRAYSEKRSSPTSSRSWRHLTQWSLATGDGECVTVLNDSPPLVGRASLGRERACSISRYLGIGTPCQRRRFAAVLQILGSSPSWAALAGPPRNPPRLAIALLPSSPRAA